MLGPEQNSITFRAPMTPRWLMREGIFALEYVFVLITWRNGVHSLMMMKFLDDI